MLEEQLNKDRDKAVWQTPVITALRSSRVKSSRPEWTIRNPCGMYVFVYVCTCPCIQMQKPEETTAWRPVTYCDTLSLTSFHLETHLTLTLEHTGWLASKLLESTCLHLLMLGLQAYAIIPGFYVAVGDSKLFLQALLVILSYLPRLRLNFRLNFVTSFPQTNLSTALYSTQNSALNFLDSV